MPAPEALPPGSTIGILGGGQLGRMLTLAAARLSFKCHIYCPDAESPAFDVAAARSVAGYENEVGLAAFGRGVDVVTYEFENVPVVAAERLGSLVPVRPRPKALEISQDRLAEKTFLQGLGIDTASFAAVDAGLEKAVAAIGLPAILKTRRFGYDGRGQVVLRDMHDMPGGLSALAKGPSILEGFVAFSREVSVIAVRGHDGGHVVYDLAENVHRDGILHTSTVPARATTETSAEAGRIARKILEALDYVGAMGIEFFVTGEGAGERLVVNEIAPRVHNSGHWTEDACEVSQFENHIRAIAGWPLGPTDRHSDVTMTNLIGADADDWQRLAAEPGARLHLYGKREARPGRKMGHVNRLSRRA